MDKTRKGDHESNFNANRVRLSTPLWILHAFLIGTLDPVCLVSSPWSPPAGSGRGRMRLGDRPNSGTPSGRAGIPAGLRCCHDVRDIFFVGKAASAWAGAGREGAGRRPRFLPGCVAGPTAGYAALVGPSAGRWLLASAATPRLSAVSPLEAAKPSPNRSGQEIGCQLG